MTEDSQDDFGSTAGGAVVSTAVMEMPLGGITIAKAPSMTTGPAKHGPMPPYPYPLVYRGIFERLETALLRIPGERHLLPILLVDGPPGSGKTMFSDHFCAYLHTRNVQCSVIHSDWFLMHGWVQRVLKWPTLLLLGASGSSKLFSLLCRIFYDFRQIARLVKATHDLADSTASDAETTASFAIGAKRFRREVCVKVSRRRLLIVEGTFSPALLVPLLERGVFCRRLFMFADSTTTLQRLQTRRGARGGSGADRIRSSARMLRNQTFLWTTARFLQHSAEMTAYEFALDAGDADAPELLDATALLRRLARQTGKKASDTHTVPEAPSWQEPQGHVLN